MDGVGHIPRPGDTVAGKYLLEAMLGQGGMGAVFRARHLLTDRKVALKWMLPDEQAGDAAVQRFLREARAMGRIDHPSVVGVIDVGVEGSAAYLVMELLRGSSLRDRIEASGKLAPAEAIALLLPAMEGLAAAHAAGVVHRDIKPDNVFCLAGGGSKVLDFGVSKLHGDRFAAPGAGGGGAITHTGAMVGTPAYMAPEQVRGERDLDARTDVWALGAILYEAISGHVPFAHETLGQTIVAIATTAPPRLESVEPTVPLALADVIHRALEKDLGTRWPTVEAFASALVPFAGGATFTAPRPSSVHPPPSELQSSPGRVSTGPLVGTSAVTRSTGEASQVSVEIEVPGSPKTSTTSATPFVSSSAHRIAPTRRAPMAWLAAGALVVSVGVGLLVSSTLSSSTSVPSSPDAPPSAMHAAGATPRDAGTDATGPIVAPPVGAPPPSAPPPSALPPSAPPPSAVPEPLHPARPHGGRAPRATTAPPTATEPPPPSSSATIPGTGRTGRLSRDDF